MQKIRPCTRHDRIKGRIIYIPTDQLPLLSTTAVTGGSSLSFGPKSGSPTYPHTLIIRSSIHTHANPRSNLCSLSDITSTLLSLCTVAILYHGLAPKTPVNTERFPNIHKGPEVVNKVERSCFTVSFRVNISGSSEALCAVCPIYLMERILPSVYNQKDVIITSYERERA